MTDPDTYTVPAGPTDEDFTSIVAFIGARLQPLIDTSYGTETWPAVNALNDVVHSIHGGALAELKRGERASFSFFTLTTIARRWRDHPDYQESWRP
jgi:hypothetical protein